VVGFLTGFFGVGGGFVIVPALVLALDYEMPVAVGTSLLVIAISSAEGVLFRLSSGGIEWGVAIPFTAGGIVGVLLGDMIASRVPAARLTRWFVWLLVAVACYTAAQSILSM
ncbi:sulfite exporter TauE/SafE family protein, partial [Mycobacterium kansasii]